MIMETNSNEKKLPEQGAEIAPQPYIQHDPYSDDRLKAEKGNATKKRVVNILSILAFFFALGIIAFVFGFGFIRKSMPSTEEALDAFVLFVSFRSASVMGLILMGAIILNFILSVIVIIQYGVGKRKIKKDYPRKKSTFFLALVSILALLATAAIPTGQQTTSLFGIVGIASCLLMIIAHIFALSISIAGYEEDPLPTL